jgi:hypothetical protein
MENGTAHLKGLAAVLSKTIQFNNNWSIGVRSFDLGQVPIQNCCFSDAAA